MGNGNKGQRRNPAEGVGARVGEDIKAMASADETGGAAADRGIDASLAPDTGRRLNNAEKVRFAIGFVLVSLLWACALYHGIRGPPAADFQFPAWDQR